jgi:hypothetical protein
LPALATLLLSAQTSDLLTPARDPTQRFPHTASEFGARCLGTCSRLQTSSADPFALQAGPAAFEDAESVARLALWDRAPN